jgi:hypothetical protein
MPQLDRLNFVFCKILGGPGRGHRTAMPSLVLGDFYIFPRGGYRGYDPEKPGFPGPASLRKRVERAELGLAYHGAVNADRPPLVTHP